MRWSTWGVVTWLLATTLLSAQAPTGTLRGRVQDATGARIRGAEIAIHLQDTSLSRSAACNDRGEFRIDDLRPGIYQFHVGAAGFGDAQADVEVIVSVSREVMVTLKPASARDSVSVRAQSSSVTTQSIDLTSQVHQTAVTRRDLTDLPLPARSFANIAYLAPGTEPVEPSDPTKARITAVSTGGSSGLNNELSVDGGDDSDDFIGGFLQNPPRWTSSPPSLYPVQSCSDN